MQVAINIENADKKIVEALKAVLKTKPEIKFKIKTKDWNEEYEELLKDYKSGKIKSYTSVKKMHEEILNG